MAKPFEVRAPGEDDREGSVIRKRSGAWIVEGWWPLGARGGPRELRITPAEDAEPGKIARGISHATLNAVPLAKMTEEYAEGAPSIDRLQSVLDYAFFDAEAGSPGPDLEAHAGRRGRSPLFYLLVAAEYAALVAAGERTPIQRIAKRIGRSPTSVSGWVRTARSMGYLTGERGHTAGQLTDEAKELLSQVAPFEPPAPSADESPVQQPIVAAIVTSRRGVLVGRRNDGKPPWTFIAGEVEPGELPEDAAVREVKEETGLEVRTGQVIGERDHPATGRHMIYMAARPVRGTTVIVGDEAELAEVRWVSVAEAEKLMGGGIYQPVHTYLVRTLRSGGAGRG
jgi:8-oxo-dGTP pyrophosphatase MutT (NUDIX family)